MAKEDEIVLLKSGKVCKKGKNSWSPRQAYIVQPSTLLISKGLHLITETAHDRSSPSFVDHQTNFPSARSTISFVTLLPLQDVNCNEDSPRGSINTGGSSDSNLERVDVALMDNNSQETEEDPVLNVVDSEGDASKAVNQKVSEETLISAHPQSDDISLSSEDGSQGNRVTFLSWMAVRFTSRRQAGQIPYVRLNMSTEDHTRNQSEISCFTRIRLALRLGRQGVQQMRTRLASAINNVTGRPNRNEEPVSDA
ncbi:uncharacterized protein [Ptychodera flava]|uniref:uncharacterized protein n=1 Tax=Ptychodera flava TaxID=63121 RepID=UPI00396A1B14